MKGFEESDGDGFDGSTCADDSDVETERLRFFTQGWLCNDDDGERADGEGFIGNIVAEVDEDSVVV